MSKPMKPHIPAKVKDPIPPAKNPGGPYTPGAKAAAAKKKKTGKR